MSENDLIKIIKALSLASQKHRRQKRRNKQSYPYINHPIEVVRLLTEVGGINDADIICAAFLHDTVEDTDTTADEIEKEFGTAVKDYVMELTDDMSLPSKTRKQKQVDTAPLRSHGAKLIKLCDKISNITDIIYDPPVFWSHHRRLEYLDWSEKVVKGMPGTNANLEKMFFEILEKGRKIITNE